MSLSLREPPVRWRWTLSSSDHRNDGRAARETTSTLPYLVFRSPPFLARVPSPSFTLSSISIQFLAHAYVVTTDLVRKSEPSARVRHQVNRVGDGPPSERTGDVKREDACRGVH